MTGRNIIVNAGSPGGSAQPSRPYLTPEQQAQRRMGDSGRQAAEFMQWGGYALAVLAFFGTAGFLLGVADSWKMSIMLLGMAAVYIGLALFLPFIAVMNPSARKPIEAVWLYLVVAVSFVLFLAVMMSESDAGLAVGSVPIDHRSVLPIIDVKNKLALIIGGGGGTASKLITLALTIGAAPLSGKIYEWGKLAEIRCDQMATGEFSIDPTPTDNERTAALGLAYPPIDGFEMWAEGLRLQRGALVPIKQIYAAYLEACEWNSTTPYSEQKFGRELRRLANETHGKVRIFKTSSGGNGGVMHAEGWTLPNMGEEDRRHIPIEIPLSLPKQ